MKYSLYCLSQEDLNEIFSHINSKVREKLNGKFPFTVMTEEESLDIINKLKIKRMAKEKVRLKALI